MKSISNCLKGMSKAPRRETRCSSRMSTEPNNVKSISVFMVLRRHIWLQYVRRCPVLVPWNHSKKKKGSISQIKAKVMAVLNVQCTSFIISTSHGENYLFFL